MTREITSAGLPATGAVDEAFAEVRASFDRFCLAVLDVSAAIRQPIIVPQSRRPV